MRSSIREIIVIYMIWYLIESTSWLATRHSSHGDDQTLEGFGEGTPQNRTHGTALDCRKNEVNQDSVVLSHFQLSEVLEIPITKENDNRDFFKIGMVLKICKNIYIEYQLTENSSS